MPVTYNCPHATRLRGFEQILCSKLFHDGVIPETIIKKAEKCCAHQYFCPTTQKWEHSYGSRTCKMRLTGGDK